MKISEILKDTNYKLTQFKTEQIDEIESTENFVKLNWNY